jgi:hypothetical protein
MEFVVLNPEGLFLQGRVELVREFPDATTYGSLRSARAAALHVATKLPRTEGYRVVRDYGSVDELTVAVDIGYGIGIGGGAK